VGASLQTENARSLKRLINSEVPKKLNYDAPKISATFYFSWFDNPTPNLYVILEKLVKDT